MMNFSKYILFILIVNCQFIISSAQTGDWIVSADKKAKLSKYEFTDSIRKHGREIYENNCISCHGHPGLGDGQKFTPPPPDPTSVKMQQNTDGDMFYKITEGRGQMSSFKDILSPGDIWSAIAYIRSFNKEYVQQIEKVIEKTGYDGEVGILLTYFDDKKTLQAKITGSKENKTEDLENVEVKLFIKRRFGNLQIDETKTSDKDGLVNFQIPENIPGDSIGRLMIIVTLTDKELYGSVSTDTMLALGNPVNLPGLNHDRAMWNKMKKAPLWILFTYFGGVLIAWSTILYILILLRKIFFIGKNEAISN
jgi:mono/diheme cytochrome c family protein